VALMHRPAPLEKKEQKQHPGTEEYCRDRRHRTTRMPELAAAAEAAWPDAAGDGDKNPEFVHHSPGDGYSAHMGSGTAAGAMTEKARYLLDLNGWLHLRGALDGAQLAAARDAAGRLTALPPQELPPGIVLEVVADNTKPNAIGCHYDKAFAFDRALESLAFHPALWPIVLELTNGRPMLKDGVLLVDDNRLNEPRGAGLHCAREDFGPEAARYEVRDGRIFCDNIAVFFYLDDVLPGDGGLIVAQGSHKSSFKRPADLYAPHNRESVASNREALGEEHGWTARRGVFPDDCALDGLVQLAPIRAGDVIVMPEALTHGVMPWLPQDRARRTLMLRYQQQTMPPHMNPPIGPDIIARLAPETRELIAQGSIAHTKEVAKKRRPWPEGAGSQQRGYGGGRGSAVLSEQQISEFKRDGVLILEGFIDEAQLASWRSQVWAGLGADPDDRSTWPSPGGGHAKVDMPGGGLTPTPGELPQFQSLINQLGGGYFSGGGAQVACIFPHTSPDEWSLPSNGHVDGYNGIWSGTGANRVSCTFYLNDVEEQGGCFTYWKGGHRRLHSFFHDHPEQLDGRFTESEAFQHDSHPYKGGDGGHATHGGTQHAAKAGTVCLWHGWTPHQASANANHAQGPRLAIISRWADRRFTGPPIKFGHGGAAAAPPAAAPAAAAAAYDWDSVDDAERSQRRWDVPDDLFRDWGPALSGGSSGSSGSQGGSDSNDGAAGGVSAASARL
jgi:ectoine hydroxylase-related dioxygenase (phytanoyl-CoA dioxygenase family)